MKDFLCDDFWCKAIKYENEHKFSMLPEDAVSTLMMMLSDAIYDQKNNQFLGMASKTDEWFLYEENWKIKLEHFEILKEQGYMGLNAQRNKSGHRNFSMRPSLAV